jgi:hypothetical protein
MAPTEISQGLYPRAPELSRGSSLSPAEQFWVVKHGIKMTGMPAWGATHADALLWDVVAFLRGLPSLSPAQYESLVNSAPAGHGAMVHEHGAGAAQALGTGGPLLPPREHEEHGAAPSAQTGARVAAAGDHAAHGAAMPRRVMPEAAMPSAAGEHAAHAPAATQGGEAAATTTPGTQTAVAATEHAGHAATASAGASQATTPGAQVAAAAPEHAAHEAASSAAATQQAQAAGQQTAAAPAAAGDHAEHAAPAAQPTGAAGQQTPAAPAAHEHGATVAEEDLPELGTGPNVTHGMMGALGGYTMMRDASGTAWQPDTALMEGIHGEMAGWHTMLHGYINGIYDHQGGPRGDDKIFSASMFMGMAQRMFGPGHLTLRHMLSLDPLMGNEGYPLLLQTGETADGVTPLIDRQHPHDFLMELAAAYNVALSPNSSVFVYAGYPGEPALGPPTFMHRFSGIENPEAPIGHHWLDATHITFGVLTAGFVYENFKVEGSVFRGREPDQHRWNFDPLTLDSASARVTWNATENWSVQVSHGFLKSPEQLEPDINQHRTTASAIYNRKLANGDWQTTLAWGRNNNSPGESSDAWLLESALRWRAHTVFGRAENTEKHELFAHGHPLHDQTFRVSKFSAGYVYDIPLSTHFSLGLGGLGSVYGLPDALEPYYGNPTSYMVFTRLKLK